MSKFFSNTISTIEELKKEYFKAAMKYHPDHGGDVETMKAINAEYAELQKKLKDKHISFKDETEVYTADTSTTETPEDFINIVNELMKLDGLDIELCGRWLWISGNTKEHKDRLKALGCKWSRNKKMWSWHYAKDGVRSHYKHTPYTIEKIHSVYSVRSNLRDSIKYYTNRVMCLSHITYNYKKDGTPFANWNNGLNGARLSKAQYSDSKDLHCSYHESKQYYYTTIYNVSSKCETFEDLQKLISEELKAAQTSLKDYNKQLEECEMAMHEFDETMTAYRKYFESKYSCADEIFRNARFY